MTAALLVALVLVKLRLLIFTVAFANVLLEACKTARRAGYRWDRSTCTLRHPR